MIYSAILMLVIALLGMILFDLKILFGILMILCAAGVLVFELVLKKKIGKNVVRYAVFGVLVLSFLLCALLPGSRTAGQAAEPPAEAPLTEAETAEGEAKDDGALLKEALAFFENKAYGEAERALSQMATKTEAYYVLRSDIQMEKIGFDNAVNQGFLDSLIEGVRDCPGSLILNYRAGIIAYAMKQYITAESYLTRAFELAEKDDPYTPYALGAVYKDLGEDAYAYAFMTIAEKNGMLKTGECDGEKIVELYRAFQKEYGKTEAAK